MKSIGNSSFPDLYSGLFIVQDNDIWRSGVVQTQPFQRETISGQHEQRKYVSVWHSATGYGCNTFLGNGPSTGQAPIDCGVNTTGFAGSLAGADCIGEGGQEPIYGFRLLI